MRKMIITLLSGKVTDYDEAYRVALIISELMENACKYTIAGAVHLQVEYKLRNSHINVCLKNITSREYLESFREIYDAVHAGTPMGCYQKMILRSTDGRTVKRQLGLARVRYEGKAKISYNIEPDIDELMEGTGQAKYQAGELALLNIQINTRVTPLEIRRD